MITANGYSKDKSIIPDGIVLTMPEQFFQDRKMDYQQFKKVFEKILSQEDGIWNFKLKNLPTKDVLYVYIIFDKQLQYRCNLVCYERNVSKIFKDAPDGKARTFPNKNWVIFSGPPVKAPHEWPLRGFQGFRYCTKLF